MNKSKTQKGSGSSRSEFMFSMLTDSWENVFERLWGDSDELKEFHEYNRMVSGIDPKGFEATCLRYKAKDVLPCHMNLFLDPITFHAEVGFNDNEMPDDVREFFFSESLESSLNEEPLEICDYPLLIEEDGNVRDMYLVKTELWNEFCDEERHPKLHVLVSIHPRYFSEIHDNVAETLNKFAEAYAFDLDVDVTINRVTNRARLACEILGRHKGRFFRRLGVADYVEEPV